LSEEEIEIIEKFNTLREVKHCGIKPKGVI
jgi:hypothetical protein